MELIKEFSVKFEIDEIFDFYELVHLIGNYGISKLMGFDETFENFYENIASDWCVFINKNYSPNSQQNRLYTKEEVKKIGNTFGKSCLINPNMTINNWWIEKPFLHEF